MTSSFSDTSLRTGPVTVWEVKPGAMDWSKRSQWSQVQTQGDALAGTGVIQSPHLVGMVRTNDGSLEISAIREDQLKPRCTLVPSVPIPDAKCSLVTAENRKGLRISSEKGDGSYTAWFTPEGLISVTADHIPQFQVKDCHLRYGLLPSFVGTDICYAPAKMEGQPVQPALDAVAGWARRRQRQHAGRRLGIRHAGGVAGTRGRRRESPD